MTPPAAEAMMTRPVLYFNRPPHKATSDTFLGEVEEDGTTHESEGEWKAIQEEGAWLHNFLAPTHGSLDQMLD